MRHSSLGVLLASAMALPGLWSSPAHALDGPSDLFASLPVTRVPNAGKAPARIGAGERVRGVVMRVEPGTSDVRTLSSERDMGREPEEQADCVQVNDDMLSTQTTWGQGMGRYFLSSRQGVMAARIESIDESKSPATLESVELFADPTTGGTRQIARRSIALAKLRDLPGESRVYGFRSDNDVHLVVVQGASKVAAQASRTPGFMAAGSRMRGVGAQCRMLHLGMSAERGDGESFTVRFSTAKELGSMPAEGEEGVVITKIEQRDAYLHASLSLGESEATPTLSLASGWAAKERVVEIPNSPSVAAFASKLRKRR